MKTWKKIALGVVALGIIGKLAGVEEQPQPQRDVVTVNEQPQEVAQTESREDVLNNYLKTDVLPTYNQYTYMRSEHLANANNLAKAQEFRGKLQVNHMKLIGVQGDLIALQSEDGCNMIMHLPTNEDNREEILTALQWVENPIVFVTITKLGRADDGKFIYMGTIDGVGAKTNNIGGLE